MTGEKSPFERNVDSELFRVRRDDEEFAAARENLRNALSVETYAEQRAEFNDRVWRAAHRLADEIDHPMALRAYRAGAALLVCDYSTPVNLPETAFNDLVIDNDTLDLTVSKKVASNGAESYIRSYLQENVMPFDFRDRDDSQLEVAEAAAVFVKTLPAIRQLYALEGNELVRDEVHRQLLPHEKATQNAILRARYVRKYGQEVFTPGVNPTALQFYARERYHLDDKTVPDEGSRPDDPFTAARQWLIHMVNDAIKRDELLMKRGEVSFDPTRNAYTRNGRYVAIHELEAIWKTVIGDINPEGYYIATSAYSVIFKALTNPCITTESASWKEFLDSRIEESYTGLAGVDILLLTTDAKPPYSDETPEADEDDSLEIALSQLRTSNARNERKIVNTLRYGTDRRYPTPGNFTINSKETSEQLQQESIGEVLYDNRQGDVNRLVIPTDIVPKQKGIPEQYNLAIRFSDSLQTYEVPGYELMACEGGVAYYQKLDQDPYETCHEQLDPVKCAEVAVECRNIGLISLANMLECGGVEIGEVNKSIKASSRYIYVEQGKERRYESMNSISEYHELIHQGKLEAQCDGVNSFEYVVLQKCGVRNVAWRLGYVLRQEATIKGGALHSQVVVEAGDRVYYLDPTPPYDVESQQHLATVALEKVAEPAQREGVEVQTKEVLQYFATALQQARTMYEHWAMPYCNVTNDTAFAKHILHLPDGDPFKKTTQLLCQVAPRFIEGGDIGEYVRRCSDVVEYVDKLRSREVPRSLLQRYGIDDYSDEALAVMRSYISYVQEVLEQCLGIFVKN